MRLRGFRPWILFFLFLLLFSGVFRVWNTPSGVYGERQIETLGVAIAYGENLRAQGWGNAFQVFMLPELLPRTTYGIDGYTEFPLLPFLAAPLFVLGPKLGSFLACFIVFLLNWVAAVYWAPRLWREWLGLRAPPAWLATACYFAIGAIEFHSSIFIPEGLAFPLLLGGAVAIRQRRFFVNLLGVAMLYVAVTTQPVIGVAWILLALWPWMIRRREIWFKREIFFHHLMLATALGAAAVTYEYWHGVAVAPFRRLGEAGFLQTIAWVAAPLWSGMFPIYCAWIWIPLALSRAAGHLALLLIMLLAVVAVEGEYARDHFPVFFGAGLGAFLLMGRVFSQPLRRSARVLAALSVLWALAYGVRTHVWITGQTNSTWAQAAPVSEALRARWNPATDFIVSDDPPGRADKLVKLGRLGAIGTGRWSEICTESRFRSRNLYFVLDPQTYFREANAGLFCLTTPGTEIVTGGADRPDEWMLVRVPGWADAN